MWYPGEFARQFFSFKREIGQETEQPGGKDRNFILRTWDRRGNIWAHFKEGMAVVRPVWLAAVITIAVTVLLQLPQLVDVLVSIARDDGFFSPRHLASFVSAILFAGAAWYFPRALLYVKYSITPPNSEERFEQLRRWVPRLLGCLPLLSLAIACGRGHQWSFAVFYLIVTAFFLRVLVVRRYLLFGKDPTIAVFLHDKMPHDTYKNVLYIEAVVTILFFLFLYFRVGLPQAIGPLGIVLLALSSWIAVGSVLLIYPTYRYTIPSLVILVVIVAAIFSFYNDNHHVRTLAGEDSRWERESVTRHFENWHNSRRDGWDKNHPGSPYPIFIVAAEGGGIRAAYWTASVLAYLEDEIPGFACHLFAISGVSGGSLGGAVFTALVADQIKSSSGYVCDGRENMHAGSLLPKARAILGEDFLAPTIAGMFFPDVVQGIVPVAAFPDRAVYLEESWEKAWRNSTTSERFSSSFSNLWGEKDQKEHYQVPSLFLNGTWVGNGMRNVTSNLKVKSAKFVHLDDVITFLDKPIRLSTAVHMSARFSYVSPAGTIDMESGDERRIVDGGYFENSGGLTASEIISSIREYCRQNNCSGSISPMALIISNNPDNPNDVTHRQEKLHRLLLPQTSSPIVTLFNTRPARGFHAEKFLQETVGIDNTFRFQLREGSEATIPLGWMLSGEVRDEIDRQVSEIPYIDTLKGKIRFE